MARKTLKWIAGCVSAVCLALLLLYISVCVPTYSKWFYNREYAKNNVYQTIGISEDELSRVTAHMLRYMRDKEPELNLTAIVNGEKRLFFNDIEIKHMADVQKLFTVGDVIKNVSAALFLLSGAVFLTVYLKKHRLFLFRCWRNACIASASLLLLIGVVVLVDFNGAFTLFHKIFFNNDMWILDPATDLLINMVPEQFFIDISVFIASVFLFLNITLTLAASGLISSEKKRIRTAHGSRD